MYSETCLILAAGRGTRMGSDIPKVMLPVAGTPILGHVINFWKRQGCLEFVFVVGYKQDIVINYISSLDLEHWTFVMQPEPRGIADAIRQARNAVPDRFTVALGDCLNIGDFDSIPSDMQQGYAYWKDDYRLAINSGCSVSIDWKGNLVDIEEKPIVKVSGMGIYWFDKKVFRYIHDTPPSLKRNEIEISDVIRNMVKAGEPVKAIGFNGTPVNCTYPRDIERAEMLLREKIVV